MVHSFHARAKIDRRLGKNLSYNQTSKTVVPMVSKLLLAFRIVVILFPTVTGVLLTSFGTSKLNAAYIVPSEPEVNPYGFLVFSTMNLAKGSTEAHFWIDQISLNERTAQVLVYCEFSVNSTSTGEQVIGFQMPHFCDFQNLSIAGEIGDLEVSDVNTVHLEDADPKEPSSERTNTTLIYARFSSSQLIEKYRVHLEFTWEGLVRKKSFSNYMISIPLADSEGDTHEEVSKRLPNASVYYEEIRVKVMIQMPEECEYIGSIIPPVQGLAQTRQTRSSILWDITNPNVMATPETTYHFTMSFENTVESEQRDHLLFDSGLYMGLGVSLIFGGLYEAIKIGTDIAKERRKA